MGENRIAQSNAYVLEVIACSLEDALQAELGGADRLELVRELNRGGLTPSLDMVRQIKEKTRLPVRVMVREEERDAMPSGNILNSMRATLSELKQLGVDGVVLGFLRDGEIDFEAMESVLSAAPSMPVTLHRAFDDTRAPLHTLQALGALPQVDHVLTSGGKGDVLDRAMRLERYREAAGGALSVLVGGGLNENLLCVLRERTSIHEFHVGRAAREPAGGNVRAHLVRHLKTILVKEQIDGGALRLEEQRG